MDITELLAFSAKQGASDLHLSAGLPPMIQLNPCAGRHPQFVCADRILKDFTNAVDPFLGRFGLQQMQPGLDSQTFQR